MLVPIDIARVLGVHPSVRATNAKEFIELVRSNRVL